MERCPSCKEMSAHKNIHTGKLFCSFRECGYEGEDDYEDEDDCEDKEIE